MEKREESGQRMEKVESGIGGAVERWRHAEACCGWYAAIFDTQHCQLDIVITTFVYDVGAMSCYADHFVEYVAAEVAGHAQPADP